MTAASMIAVIQGEDSRSRVGKSLRLRKKDVVHRMKSSPSYSRSVGASWKIIFFLSALLPVSAFGHDGGNKGPWIDFSQYGFDGITQMMNAHPAFVHFPIALLPAILVFYCLGTWFKWPSLLIAGRATLYLAFLSLIIVVYTGLRARSAPSNEAIEAIMQTHKNTGFVIMGIVTLLVLWSFWTVNEPPTATTGPLRFLAQAGRQLGLSPGRGAGDLSGAAERRPRRQNGLPAWRCGEANGFL